MIHSIEKGIWDRTILSGLSPAKVAILDADTYLYLATAAGDFSESRMLLDRLILKTLQETGCRLYMPYLTDTGNIFRSDISKVRPYKGNRDGKVSPLLLPSLRLYATREWNFMVCPRLEADDCVAYVHQSLTSQYPDLHFTVCSPDKDVLRQLPGRHYNYQKGEYHITSPVDSHRFLWTQVLSGDHVDGIPGIPGIGDVKAKAILDVARKEKEFPLLSLRAYMNHFQEVEAVHRFKETFDLVYLLRQQDDYFRHGLTLPRVAMFDLKDVINIRKDETGGSVDPSA